MTAKMKSSEMKNLKETWKRMGVEIEEFQFIKYGNNIIALPREFDIQAINFFNSKTVGTLVGWFDGKGFMFTIEGAQMVIKDYKKVLELTEKELFYWMHGQNFEKDLEEDYYLLKYKNEIVGWAKIRNKNLLNNVQKERVIFRL